jgi:hypothetical protein
MTAMYPHRQASRAGASRRRTGLSLMTATPQAYDPIGTIRSAVVSHYAGFVRRRCGPRALVRITARSEEPRVALESMIGPPKRKR